MRLKSSASRLCIALGLLSCAAPAICADLLQVYRDALANDQQYAAARAASDALREKLPQGLSTLLPTINAMATTVWNDNKYSTDSTNTLYNVDKQYNTNAYNVQLTQPLFRWQNYVQYGQGQLQVVQADANLAQSLQDLIVRVAGAYFDVLYAQENLKAVRANKQSIAQQLEQAKKNFEVGTATITDSQEAQSRFDLASAQEIAAINDLEVKRYALRVIVGKNYGELNRLKPQAEIKPPQPASMEQWVDAAQKDSFAVQAQQAASEVAAKEVERQRAGHYPTVDVIANYGKNNTALSVIGNDSLETNARNIGLQLNIPLFQGGYVNSKTREAVANRAAADAALETAKRSAVLNTQQSFLGVVNGLAQVKALDAALISSTSALESNKLGYEVGVRINIDVLNAEQQVYVTKRDLSKARFDTLLAQLKLKAAVGALSEADLEQINPLFEAP